MAPGEIVTLVGANGSGKTTTLRAISGLLRPPRGAHHLRRRATGHAGAGSHRGARDRAGAGGRTLFPSLTVREHLELGAYTRRAKPRRRVTLDEVMDRFPRLRERADQRAGTLSGGEQQMCAIARALMALPSLLMLDEPSHGIWDEPWTPNGYASATVTWTVRRSPSPTRNGTCASPTATSSACEARASEDMGWAPW